jgi:hypothetical protein
LLFCGEAEESAVAVVVALAVILSEAKDPEAPHSPMPFEPFNQQPKPVLPQPTATLSSPDHPNPAPIKQNHMAQQFHPILVN